MKAFYENVSEMEPLLPSREGLEENAILLLKRSSELEAFLHPITRTGVARLITLMNSYYSNLIEGNPTLPLDIERALHGEYKTDSTKRGLQLEAKAHVEVELEFEEKLRRHPDHNICSAEFLKDIHRALYDRLPPEFRIVRDEHGNEVEIIPGELRKGPVSVGGHIPPLASSLDRFLARFERVYEPSRQRSSIDRILVAAASHHRIAWIHPFPDGNGRVGRLFTHFYFVRASLGGNGLWALSRGLARKRDEYYAALAAGDAHRYNDYDGRGNLSLKGLNSFVAFLLDTSIDQVDFMGKMLELDTAGRRLREYARVLAAREELGVNAAEAVDRVLTAIFARGELPRREISHVTGMPDRSARRITELLSKNRIIVSDTPLAPWKLNFTVDSARSIFPALFPV